MLAVRVAGLADFGLVVVSKSLGVLLCRLRIKKVIRAAPFSQRIQDLLCLRSNDDDWLPALVRGLVVLWGVRPDGFGRVDV